MVANIRVIPTIKKYEGSFYVPNLASKQTSQDFVSPLLDFEPKYASCEVAGALIFNGSEKWNGTTDYNNGVQTLKCYREQIGSQWRVTFKFYNASTYPVERGNVSYRSTN